MINCKLKTDKDNTKEITKALKYLSEKEVEVGVFEDDFKHGNKLTNYGKAIINEYGATIKVTDKMRAFLHYNGIHLKKDTTTIKIPERSFIRGSFDKNIDTIDKTIEKMLGDVIEGKMTADNMINTIGENSVKIVRKYIQNFIPSPNSPLTLDNKKGSTPIIDTGELLKALDWRMVDKQG